MDPLVVGLIASSLLFGLLGLGIGRRWAVGIPALLTALVVVPTALQGLSQGEDVDFSGPFGSAAPFIAIGLTFGIVATTCTAAGVLLRRMMRKRGSAPHQGLEERSKPTS